MYARQGALSRAEINLDNARRKQINTLMVFNDHVSEIQPGLHYKVDFDHTSGQVALHVFLPPGFPNERPGLRAKVPTGTTHPWLDPSGNVVGAPGLVNYTPHSDIGRLVLAVKRELEKNLVRGDSQPTQASPLSSLPNSQSQALPHQHQSQSQSQYTLAKASSNSSLSHDVNLLKIAKISKLKSASLEELKTTDNPMELKVLCKHILDSDTNTKRLLNDIRLARRDVSEFLKNSGDVQENLVKAKKSFEEQIDNLMKTRDDVIHLAQSTSVLCSEFSLQSLCLKLQSQSTEQDEKSEEIAETFIQGNLSCDSFLSEYIQSRSQYHSLKLRHDKLKQQKVRHNIGFR